MSASEWNSVYEPLRAHLLSVNDPVVTMSFGEIELVLGRQLPASARTYPAWWANERTQTHNHARAWLDAGRQTEHVDLNGARVSFVL